MARTTCMPYAVDLGLECIWATLVNVYGIGGKSDLFIMSLIQDVLNSRPQNFTSAEQIYNFIYVSDAAKGIFLAAEKGKSNAIYTVGSGKARQLKEFIMAVFNELDPNERSQRTKLTLLGILSLVRPIAVTFTPFFKQLD